MIGNITKASPKNRFNILSYSRTAKGYKKNDAIASNIY